MIGRTCTCGRRAIPGTSRCELHPAQAPPASTRRVQQPYRKGYSKDYSAFRRAVMDRARGRCESCGADSDKLASHHVVPLSEGGTNDPSNGLALCPSCHRRAHGKRP